METPVILLFPRAWDLGFFFFFNSPYTPESFLLQAGVGNFTLRDWCLAVSEAKISLQFKPLLICCPVAWELPAPCLRLVLRSLKQEIRAEMDPSMVLCLTYALPSPLISGP